MAIIATNSFDDEPGYSFKPVAKVTSSKPTQEEDDSESDDDGGDD